MNEFEQKLRRASGAVYAAVDGNASIEMSALFRDAADRIATLEGDRERLIQDAAIIGGKLNARIATLEAQLEAAWKLPEEWRKYDFNNPDAKEFMDAGQCADQLDALRGLSPQQTASSRLAELVERLDAKAAEWKREGEGAGFDPIGRPLIVCSGELQSIVKDYRPPSPQQATMGDSSLGEQP